MAFCQPLQCPLGLAGLPGEFSAFGKRLQQVFRLRTTDLFQYANCPRGAHVFWRERRLFQPGQNVLDSAPDFQRACIGQGSVQRQDNRGSHRLQGKCSALPYNVSAVIEIAEELPDLLGVGYGGHWHFVCQEVRGLLPGKNQPPPGEPPTWKQSILLSNGWEVKLCFRDVHVQELRAIIPAPRNGQIHLPPSPVSRIA